MSATPLSVGFIPLVDAAPLIVAERMGFAAEEGLALDLRRGPSWSAVRDMLAIGQVQAAHLLAPVPVAQALGLGGSVTALDAVSVLSVNGNVIGVSPALAERMRAAGHRFDFDDAAQAGRALIAAAEQPLRVGVPFPFSMHAELVYYWLSALGLPSPQNLSVRTVPPAMMPDAMAAGEIDAFCVGEPWGSYAVERGDATLLLPGSAIWSFAPEKVLAVRTDWAAAEHELRGCLIRAVWRAGRWLADPEHRLVAAELLSRAEHLNISAELIERALSGRIVISGTGEERRVPRFLEFHAHAASFPWRSQGAWIGAQLSSRTGLDRAQSALLGAERFRSDYYRAALDPVRCDLPTASARVEGGLAEDSPAGSRAGRLILAKDAFFDGRTFDPEIP
ncbi:ABC transporter substrate-binding protein [Ponticoccus alexandrii]|uniref:ABC transporter substrate-binding protein n=1 Tax=Ponticoccus alexandrii TaxID=1943633 RepID=A0ABX7FFQ7_9RHOB|nr:CmpA/NrtA family ABC transporter substrate-binding protein [Ponticoccus alexandrii]ETA49605.1 nitrate transporter [Rhodobacteraceae bacterium PD-2]QRF68894.1 ABC transporter substrate-binding protein [Ponticoccus alexandrii]